MSEDPLTAPRITPPPPSGLSPISLETMVDHLPDMIYRVDAQGRLVYASGAITSIFGYSKQEALGSDALDHYVDPTQRTVFLAAIRDNGGSVRNYDLHFFRKDGSKVWVSISAQWLLDSDGTFQGIEGIARDIDQRKLDEQSLAENRNLVQTLLDASSDAIMLFDREGTFLSLNRVMSDRFKKSPQDLIGTCLWDLFPPEVALRRAQACIRVLETHEPTHMTDQRDGHYYRNAIYPVLNAEGKADKIAVFSRDITHEIEAQERIKHYLLEVEQSNRDLESFAFAASHDLREPLRMIGSFTHLLETRYGAKFDQEGQEYIGFIKSGVDRLGILIRDLLDYARIGQHEVQPGPIDMRALIWRIWQDCQIAVQESQATLTINHPLPAVYGYELLIERMMGNLIANALNYRHPDRPPQVCVGYDEERKAWFVRDNGIGIDPSHHKRVFAMFQRLDGNWKVTGSGLGLAIVQRAAERHGGRAWVESAMGLGATFYISLRNPRPLASGRDRPELEHANTAATAPHAPLRSTIKDPIS